MSESATSESVTPTKALSVGAAAFAVLQSVCTLLVGLAGVQTLIGVTAFSSAVLRYAVPFHTDVVRIPMLIFAVVAAIVVLYSVQRKRSLRARAAGDWRRRPLPKKKIRQERVQMVLAVGTLALVLLELALHSHLHHHL